MFNYKDLVDLEATIFDYREESYGDIPFASALLERMGDNSNPYFSPFNCIYTFQINHLINQYPEKNFIVRDGVYPILSYFVENIGPPDHFNGKLILPWIMRNFVPIAWREKVFFYDFYFQNKNIAQSEILKLWLYNHNDSLLFPRDLSSIIEKVNTYNFRLIEIRDLRTNQFFSSSELKGSSIDTLLKISQTAKTKIQWRDDPRMKGIPKNRIAILNIADPLYLFDFFNFHNTAKAGASVLRVNEDANGKIVQQMPLSLHHGVNFIEFDKTLAQFEHLHMFWLKHEHRYPSYWELFKVYLYSIKELRSVLF